MDTISEIGGIIADFVRVGYNSAVEVINGLINKLLWRIKIILNIGTGLEVFQARH